MWIRPSRFTPERRPQYLEHLHAGIATTEAAAEVGITTAAVYQRRRDAGFAAAMDRAIATRVTPEPAGAATWLCTREWGSGTHSVNDHDSGSTSPS
ncbi:hypothetical protein ACIA98_36060 [Streptomyces sp. NPDC051366]|uniref:hypothetical protein n=1 Tax=Streptomyces sp. NPDC051366 TaxID=3365652 RepID=UPI0037AABC07